MKSNLTVLKLQEVEAPQLLAEALNDDLFKKLKMNRIAVQISNFKKSADLGGLCINSDHTQMDEVEISSEFFEDSSRPKSKQIETIVSIYLHECAHRITNQSHFGGFLCLNILLHIRAGNNLVNKIRLYDWHQENNDMAETFKFAWNLAKNLAETDITAEQAGEIILQKYNAWSDQMDRAPAIEEERLQQAESRKQAAAANRKKELQAIENQIKSLQQDRWMFAFAAAVITVLAVSFFN